MNNFSIVTENGVYISADGIIRLLEHAEETTYSIKIDPFSSGFLTAIEAIRQTLIRILRESEEISGASSD